MGTRDAGAARDADRIAGGATAGRGSSDGGAAAGGTSNAATAVVARTHLSVASDLRDAFRGDPLLVHGQLRADGAAAGGLRISLELLGKGNLRVPLGDVLTSDNGEFSVTVELPRTLPLGDYQLSAHTDGDATRSASRSLPSP